MFHNNTPASIVEAPEATAKYIHVNDGPNREQRRHGYDPFTGKKFFKNYENATSNTPYRKKDETS